MSDPVKCYKLFGVQWCVQPEQTTAAKSQPKSQTTVVADDVYTGKSEYVAPAGAGRSSVGGFRSADNSDYSSPWGNWGNRDHDVGGCGRRW